MSQNAVLLIAALVIKGSNIVKLARLLSPKLFHKIPKSQ